LYELLILVLAGNSPEWLTSLNCHTGHSGSGKSSLISQFLVDAVADRLGHRNEPSEDDDGLDLAVETLAGEITEGVDKIKRLVVVDQKPIGRTPQSNLATYTGLFDHVRKLFAATKLARARRYDAGRFSFNVAKGRCETCQGEGFVCVAARPSWAVRWMMMAYRDVGRFRLRGRRATIQHHDHRRVAAPSLWPSLRRRNKAARCD
jgi:hypothetical protein